MTGARPHSVLYSWPIHDRFVAKPSQPVHSPFLGETRCDVEEVQVTIQLSSRQPATVDLWVHRHARTTAAVSGLGAESSETSYSPSLFSATSQSMSTPRSSVLSSSVNECIMQTCRARDNLIMAHSRLPIRHKRKAISRPEAITTRGIASLQVLHVQQHELLAQQDVRPEIAKT